MTETTVFTRLRKSIGTIRFRITALAVLAVVVVLVTASTALVVAQRRLLTENLDDALEQRAGEIESLVVDGRLPSVLTGIDEDTVAQVVTADGEVLAATPNFTGQRVMARPIAESPPHTIEDLPVDPPHATDRYRLLVTEADGSGGSAYVYTAGLLEDVDESTAVLARSVLVVVPAAAALLGLVVWWLVGRTLRPVEAIRREVAEIGGSDLRRRVPVPDTDDEIARLARTMNDMLVRVDAAAERQRRFIADASHELRSPLARIRSELEVDLAHPEEADFARSHRSVLEETTGLQRLVDDLLHLARSDAGVTTSVRHEPVDLDDIVLRNVQWLRAARNGTIDISGVTAAQVVGDVDQLNRAVANLIDNAARHARSKITITLAEHDGEAVLTVADDGPGIPPEQHERVFERFTRLDDARAAATGGTGLGLAIVRDVVERHHGSVVIDPEYRVGARFIVTLPVAANGSPVRRAGS
jgi:signal transduction histidine kinase